MTLGHGIKYYPIVERSELLGGQRVELRFLYSTCTERKDTPERSTGKPRERRAGCQDDLLAATGRVSLPTTELNPTTPSLTWISRDRQGC